MQSTQTTEPVFRWGILGAGHIAGKWASDLTHVPGARLQAVWARDPAKSAEFGIQHGARRAAASIESLLGEGDLDAVYVASPHGLHHDHALACLEAGIPVLCEKAFTLNARQARELVDTAKRRGVFLMEALWTRFLPGFDAALRLARSGDLGKPLSVDADFGFAAPFDPDRRLWNPAMGGGSLLDIGLYPLFFASSFLGGVQSFQATLELAPNGVDHTFRGTFVHKGGGGSSCLSTFLSPTPCQARIVLEDGELLFPWMFHTPVDVEVRRGTHREILPGRVPGNGYQCETLHAQRCLQAGLVESPSHPLSETLALMELLDSIQAQAQRLQAGATAIPSRRSETTSR